MTDIRPAQQDTAGRPPKVSIGLLTYNGAATVERAVTSLLSQSFDDFELIISDDHSRDDTPSICQRAAAGDARVRFIRPPNNVGAQPNMRFALSHARGKYFLWASQDDYWEPQFLERLVSLLEADAGAICAMARTLKVYPDGTDAGESSFSGRDLPERQSRLKLAIATLAIRSWEGRLKTARHGIFILGLIDRRIFSAVLEAHGRIAPYERQLVAHLALTGRFRYVDEPLFRKTRYRVQLAERRAAEDAVVTAQRDVTDWRYVADTLAGIARSTVVPVHLKLAAIPALFVSFWGYELVLDPMRRWIRRTKHRWTRPPKRRGI